MLTSTDELKTRDAEIDEELEELENEAETHPSKKAGLQDDIDELRDEQGEIEEVRGACEDFNYGAPMIEVDDFEGYAQQYAVDVGSIEENGRWPTNCIDWERAAEQLAQDFTEVTYRGTRYYVR